MAPRVCDRRPSLGDGRPSLGAVAGRRTSAGARINHRVSDMAVGMSAARVIWVLLSDICNLYWVKFKIWDRDRKYIIMRSKL